MCEKDKCDVATQEKKKKGGKNWRGEMVSIMRDAEAPI